MDSTAGVAPGDDVETARRQNQSRPKAGDEREPPVKGGMHSSEEQRSDEETPLLRDGASSSGNRSNDGTKPSWTDGSEWDGLPWYKRPSVFWLLGPFVLSALAFGGIIVPKVNLILTLICREYYSDRARADPAYTLLPIQWGEDNPQCRVPEVQAYVARFTLYGTLISGLLSAVIAPKLGALSDRYGRKRIMMITNAGMLCGEIITIFAGNFPETFPVKWILLGYVFDGLCGSFIASMALSHSYATDCTPPNKRNVVFGYFHGCLFTGIALGPLAAGFLTKWTGTLLTMFYVALGFHVFFIFFLMLVIPESLSKSRQLAAREKYRAELDQLGPAADWINQLRSFNLFAPLKVLYPTGPGSSPALRRNLLLLSSVDTIIFGVAMGALSVILIYSNYMFAWDTYWQSIFMSVVNTARVFCLLVFLPGLTRFFRGPSSRRTQSSSDSDAPGTDRFELNVIRAAIFFDMVGFLGYTLSRSGGLFIASGAVASFGGMGSPTLQAALTKHVRPEDVGALFGAMGLLHALARVVSPTIFNGIYSVTVGRFTQTIFVMLTSLFGVAFALALLVRPGVKVGSAEPESQPEYRDDANQTAVEAEDELGI